MPSDWTLSTRRARFSISVAHAASILGRDVLVIEAREQLGGDIRALVCGQREGLAKKFSRALSHVVILASSLLSILRWSRRRR
jgi:NADPH-dependent 2,4-dienoyl-CoA reductase/sulfur reductase-like enzyme